MIIIIISRSTGTVHTSAKAHLTSVMIQIQIRDPDRYQNLIICSLAHWLPFLKISCNSVWRFLLTDRQTNKQRQLHNILGGGNNLMLE